MEAVATPPSASAPAAAAPQPAAPSPNYNPPAPPSAPPAQTMEEGGATSSGNPIKRFFSDINVVDVTVSAFIVAAVIYSIQYHKFMMMIEKTGYADLSSRVQKLESSIAAAKKTAEANASGNGRMKRRRPIL
jgi:hypothetical protein